MNLLLLLIISNLTSCIELEISVPSFPEIVEYFSASENAVGLIVTYNLIGFGISSILYGPLSEYYGRRKIMIIGNSVLTIGSLGCVFSQSIEVLLLFRFIQGVGAATSAVLLSAIIGDVYNYQKASKFYGTMNAFSTIVISMSPIVGGIITFYVGWYGNFSFIAIISIIAWIILYLHLPETIKEKSRILSIKKIMSDYFKLFPSRVFCSALILPSLLFASYISFLSIAPFVYMNEFKLSLMGYTIHQGFACLIFGLASLFAHKFTELTGEKNIIYISKFFVFLGSVVIIFANNVYLVTAGISVFYIGAAFLYPLIFAKSLEIFPEMKGTASSAIIAFRYLICSGITSVMIYLYDGNFIVAGFTMLAMSFTIALLSIHLTKNLDFT